MVGLTACTGSEASFDLLAESVCSAAARPHALAGLAVRDSLRLQLAACSGPPDSLADSLCDGVDGRIQDTWIAHARTATTPRSAPGSTPPHSDCTGEVAVIINGQIENTDRIRRQLRKDGHALDHGTKSELIAHLVESKLSSGMTTAEAFRSGFDRITGRYTAAVLFAGERAVYVTLEETSLIVGRAENDAVLATDIPSLAGCMNRVVHPEDRDFLRLDGSGVQVRTRLGKPTERPVQTLGTSEVPHTEFD